MKITSFDSNINNRISRDYKQDNLFDLFQKNIIYVNNIALGLYIVPREFEMRLDRISLYIYGTSDYVEELMVLNDIISPYSVKQNQYIFYCSKENLSQLYVTDKMRSELNKSKQQLIDSSNTNKRKQTSGFLPPTVKPDNLDQITVTKDNKVKIINKFE